MKDDLAAEEQEEDFSGYQEAVDVLFSQKKSCCADFLFWQSAVASHEKAVQELKMAEAEVPAKKDFVNSLYRGKDQFQKQVDDYQNELDKINDAANNQRSKAESLRRKMDQTEKQVSFCCAVDH